MTYEQLQIAKDILDIENIENQTANDIIKVLEKTSYFLDMLEERRIERVDRKYKQNIVTLEKALNIVKELKFESIDQHNYMKETTNGLEYIISSMNYIDKNYKKMSHEKLPDFSFSVRKLQNHPTRNDILKASVLHIALILEYSKSDFDIELEKLINHERANLIVSSTFKDNTGQNEFSMDNLKWLSFNDNAIGGESIGVLLNVPSHTSGYAPISTYTYLRLSKISKISYECFEF